MLPETMTVAPEAGRMTTFCAHEESAAISRIVCGP
jgi:hypothetical protein